MYLKNVNLTQLFLSSKLFDINAQSKSGDSCMRIVCTYASDQIAKILLTDPDINLILRNDNLETPADIARRGGKLHS